MKRKDLRYGFIMILMACTFALLVSCGPGGGADSGEDLSTASIKLSADPDTVPADGRSSAAITAKLETSSGGPVAKDTLVTFSTTLGSFRDQSTSYTVSTPDDSGSVLISLIAGLLPGKAEITATSNQVTQNASMEFTGAPGVPNRISLATSQISVKSDNSDSATITATILDGKNAVVEEGLMVAFSTDGGQLSASSVETDANGQAQVTFSSGTLDPKNGIATITATVSGIAPAQIPIQILGSTLTLSTDHSTITTGGSRKAVLTVLAKDAGGNPVYNTPITLRVTGTGRAILSPNRGNTDTRGELKVTVTGTRAGEVTVTAEGLGETATQDYTVNPAGAGFFHISEPSDNLVHLHIGKTLTITVTAPAPTTSVVFVATFGNWDGGASAVITKDVSGGQASAVFSSGLAGVASVQVYDENKPALSDSCELVVTAPVKDAANITLQSNTYIVPQSVGDNTYTATLTATVRTSSASGRQPVKDAAIALSIKNQTGGGETVYPAIVFTDDSGVATTTFTSGSLSSGAEGVMVIATVLGQGATGQLTTISFNDSSPATITRSDSGSFVTDDFEAGEQIKVEGSASNDGNYVIAGVTADTLTLETGETLTDEAADKNVTITAVTTSTNIVIGGTAGSLVIGRGSKIEVLSPTTYSLPMSVLVADSNGNPMPGAAVSLSAWPDYYSTGYWMHRVEETMDPTTGIITTKVLDECYAEITGTYPNEDLNENLFLDPGEDVGSDPGHGDGQLTPPNSAAGTVPMIVTTDENGVANFDLIYMKSSAFWITDRIRASTLVLGTEMTSTMPFRLPAERAEAEACELPSSPYNREMPADHIRLTASPNNLTADGSSTSLVQAQVTDTNGTPVDGAVITFELTSGTGTLSTPKATTSAGIAAINYTASTTPGTNTVTATATNGVSATVDITLIKAIVGAVTATAGCDSIVADGTSQVQILATVFDTYGKYVLDGTPVSFTTTAGSIPAVVTTINGVATATLTSSTNVGTANITATAGGVCGKTAVEFIPGPVTKILLTATPPNLTADGSSESILRAFVTDVHNNAVESEVISFSISTKTGKLSAPTAATSGGVAEVTYTAATSTITEIVRAEATNGTLATVSITLIEPIVKKIECQVGCEDIVAGGFDCNHVPAGVEDPVLVHALVYDLNSNFVPDGTPVTITTTAGTFIGAPAPGNCIVVNTINGEVTAMLQSTTIVGTANITIWAGGVCCKETVTFIPGPAANILLTATPPNVTADGSSESIIRAFVTDANGNAVVGETIRFTITSETGKLSAATAVTDGGGGVAIVTYTAAITTGPETVTAESTNRTSASVDITLIEPIVKKIECQVGCEDIVSGGFDCDHVPTGVEDPVLVHALVYDLNSNFVPDGTPVTITTTAGTFIGAPAPGNCIVVNTINGEVTAMLQSTTIVGTANITIWAGGVCCKETVSFIPGPVANILLTATPPNVTSDGSSESIIRAFVTDAHGNAVVSETIRFTITSETGKLSAATAVTDGGGGVAIVTYTAAITTGPETVTAESTNRISASVDITLIEPIVKSIECQVGCEDVVAGDTSCVGVPLAIDDEVLVHALVYDLNDNFVPDGTRVTITTTAGTFVGTDPLGPCIVVETINGEVSAMLKSPATEGTADITVWAGGVCCKETVEFISEPVPAKISLSTSQISVKSDNSDSATITATVLDANNVVVEGIMVAFSADGGQLSAASAETEANGQAQVTFSSGTIDKSNRTVAITATVGGLDPAQIPIQILGSTLEASTDNTSITNDGTTMAVLTILAKDAGGNPVYNTPITLSVAGTGEATLSANTGLTDVSGQLQVTVTGGGTTAGSVTVTAQGLGTTATQDYTVSTVGGMFGIIQPTVDPCSWSTVDPVAIVESNHIELEFCDNDLNPDTIERSSGSFVTDGFKVGNRIMVGGSSLNDTDDCHDYFKIAVVEPLKLTLVAGDVLRDELAGQEVIITNGVLIRVQAPDPNTENVVFSTTFGVWDHESSAVVTKPVVNGLVSAVFSSSLAGVATIQVNDADPERRDSYKDSMQVVVSSPTGDAAYITLQSNTYVVPMSVGDIEHTATLTASVRTNSATGRQPVGGAPVAFTVTNQTGGGETVFPVIAYTDSSGVATATFTSGSLSSGAEGVTVAARVLDHATTGPLVTLSFSDNTPNQDTITRSDPGGSFITDGFQPAEQINIEGSTSNDGDYIIASVTDDTLTLEAGETLIDEPSVSTGQLTTISFEHNVVGSDTITRSDDGSFVTDGFKAGEEIRVVGSANNDGNYVIVEVTENTLTLAGGEPLTTEAEGNTVTIERAIINNITITAVATSTNIVIGGTSGSLVIGRGSEITVLSPTTYSLPMSVLVADSNGNPMSGATVSLNAWPSFYSTGSWVHPYEWDPDREVYWWRDECVPNITGTYPNEDANENLFLDPGEDVGSNPGHGDGQLTPPNSAAGTVPMTVTTDENGVANFDLVYMKSSAIWITDRIRASTLVLGTETTSSMTFRLPAEKDEAEACELPDSPYNIESAVTDIYLVAVPSELTADGSSTSTVRATITDQARKPIAGEVIRFLVTTGTGTLSSPFATTNDEGVAEITYTASTTAGTETVTATATNQVSATVDITLSGGSLEPSEISLAISQISVRSDNSDSATITATVLDERNAVIEGTLVAFSADGGQLSAPNAETDSNGQAQVLFSSGTVDKSNQTVTINATVSGTQPPLLAQITMQILGSTLEASTDNTSITNDGATTAVLAILAKDAGGNPVYNTPITLSAAGTGEASLSHLIIKGNTKIAFADSNPDTITRNDDGSFEMDGFDAGEQIKVEGSTRNNGIYTIKSVARSELTLVSGDNLQDELEVASVTITNVSIPLTLNTNVQGVVKVVVTGNSAGSVTVTAQGLGTTATQDYTVSTVVGMFGIIQPTVDPCSWNTMDPGPVAIVESNQQIAFNDNDPSPDTIVRWDGRNFTEDGFKPGDRIMVGGSSSNDTDDDHYYYEIAEVCDQTTEATTPLANSGNAGNGDMSAVSVAPASTKAQNWSVTCDGVAEATAPAAGPGNTGQGAMGAVSVDPANTKTEDWSVTCDGVAEATAPAAGPGNTGQGAMGVVSVDPANTKTEDWSVTCITAAADGGVFSVTGTVSGAQTTDATVGMVYTSDGGEVSFTISDGDPDFVVNDSFTFSTSATTFSISGGVSGIQTNQAYLYEPYTSDNSEVSFTISDGDPDFVVNDSFTFSTSATAFSVSGDVSGIQTNQAYLYEPYTSDAGEVSFGITSGSSDFQVGDSFTFTVGATLTLVEGDELTNEAIGATVTITNGVLIRVQAPDPDTDNVVFSTTFGVWNHESSAVVNGLASAIFSSSLAGVATIQVYDADPARRDSYKDSMQVVVSSPTGDAAYITLQSNTYMVPISVGEIEHTATLTASVRTSSATGSQPVDGAPVAFSVTNQTGGGEAVFPAIAYTDSSGVATTTFTSGSLSSGAEGVTVVARVLDHASTGPLTTVSFHDSNPDTIMRVGGSFITDRFQSGEQIKVEGSASNDGSYIIASVAADTLTLEAGETLTPEDAGNDVTITAVTTSINIVISEPAPKCSVVLAAAEITGKVANGIDSYTIVAQVMDTSGQPMADQTVTFLASDNTGMVAINPPVATTQADGTTTCQVTDISDVDDTVNITASCGGVTSTNTIGLVFTGGVIEPLIASIELSANPSSLPADGVSQATISATLTLVGGGDVPDGTTVDFSITDGGGSISPTATTVGGVALAFLTSDNTAGTVTVRAGAGGRIAEIQVEYTPGSVTLTIIPNSLLGTGEETAMVTATVKNAAGSAAFGETVSFTLDDLSLGSLNPDTPQTTDAQGQAQVTFQEAAKGGTVTVTGTWDVGGVYVTGSETITIQAPPAFIEVADGSPDPTSINIKGTGGKSTSRITFDVKDNQGNPVADGYRIDFYIDSGPNGGENIVPLSARTQNGQVSTILYSGFKSGPVSIRATYYNNSNVSTTTSQITILAGPPVGEEFGIFAEYLNISGLWMANLIDPVSISAADIYGNAIPDYTAISFKTYNTGGFFESGAATTTGGVATDDLHSAGTYLQPLQGFVSVTAEAINGGRTTHVTSLAVTPSPDNHIIYAGTDGGGVYKSTNSGATWVNISRSTENPKVGQNWMNPHIKGNSAICVDPDDHNVVYVGTGYLGRGNVYRSLDGGMNWNSNNIEEWNGIFSVNEAVLTVSCDGYYDDDLLTDSPYIWIGTEGLGALYAPDGTNFQWGGIIDSGPTAIPNPGDGRTMTEPTLWASSKTETWTATYQVPPASATVPQAGNNQGNGTISNVATDPIETLTEAWLVVYTASAGPVTCPLPDPPGNIGDGTVSGIQVKMPNWHTESWKLTCIDDTTAGAEIFSVESDEEVAPYPDATVGTQYDQDTISFEIVSGTTTDFVAGDVLEFTTTAEWQVTGTISGMQANTATTGSLYTSDDNQVKFTIYAGSALFAVGDQFTFSTTASTPYWSVFGDVSGQQFNRAYTRRTYTSDSYEVTFTIFEGTTPFAQDDEFTFHVTESGLGYGKNVRDIVRAPDTYKDGAVLYAATNIGVFRSIDGGQVWSDKTHFTGDFITTLALHPSSTGGINDIIYAGTEDAGVWSSVDSGANWAQCTGGMGEGLSATTSVPGPDNEGNGVMSEVTVGLETESEYWSVTCDAAAEATTPVANSGNTGQGTMGAMSVDPANTETQIWSVTCDGVAEATAPVPGAGNTGNGVMGAVSVDPANTMTEDWSVTCDAMAEATTPVPGPGNTGQGVMGAVSVDPANTKTEDWSVTCITAAADGGVFSVTGTVSGAQAADATVGIVYTSDGGEVSFTISDGAPDFIVGDSFTFSTSATAFSVDGSVAGLQTNQAYLYEPYTSDAGEVSFAISDGSNNFVVGDSFTFSTSATTFNVSGSVSGLQINKAYLYEPYTSDGGEVSFTISDGDPDFVVGDSFTFCTSAMFSVSGSVSGLQTNQANLCKPYTSDNSEVTFTISEGSIDFQVGDTFTFSTTRDPGRTIKDLLVDSAHNKLYAITYFWGASEPHAVGNVYVIDLDVSGVPTGDWSEANTGLPQYDPPDDTTLFAQHVMAFDEDHLSVPSVPSLYIGGEGINLCKATSGLDADPPDPVWQDSKSGLTNLIMARMPILFSGVCAMDITQERVGDTVTYTVYIQDTYGNPPIEGSMFIAKYIPETGDEVILFDKTYPDCYTHTGTFSDPADPRTNNPYRTSVTVEPDSKVTFTFTPRCMEEAPGCSGSAETRTIPY